MSSGSYQDYLKSEYWQTVTKAVKARAGWKCQICNSPHDLNAHHRTYDNRGNELNHLDDLTCLCRRCHAIFHGKTQDAESHEIRIRDRLPKQKKNRISSVIHDHDSDMPTGENIILTKEMVYTTLRTKAGGFTGATQAALGVPSRPERGWARELVGKTITRSSFRKALEGRAIYT